MKEQPPGDLSCGQAAELLGISRTTLTRMANAHEVPHYRYGKRILFSPKHLEQIRRAAERPALPVSALSVSSRRRAQRQG